MFGSDVTLKRSKPLPLPDGFSEKDIKIESSICTGEKTIGFFSNTDKKLHFAELVRSGQDIDDFYAKYGVKR